MCIYLTTLFVKEKYLISASTELFKYWTESERLVFPDRRWGFLTSQIRLFT